MKRLLITLTLVLSILSISALTQQPKPPQWEYKFDYKCSEKRANDLALQGWELLATSESSNGVIATQTCIFKRSK